MKVLVLLNQKSGTLAASRTCDEPERVRRGFELRGVDAVVRCVDADRLAAEATGAAAERFDAVIAGGGTAPSTPSPTPWPAAPSRSARCRWGRTTTSPRN